MTRFEIMCQKPGKPPEWPWRFAHIVRAEGEAEARERVTRAHPEGVHILYAENLSSKERAE